MTTRKLTPSERARVRLLLEEIRASLRRLSGGDLDLLFALRRKVWKELVYDERLKPAARAALRRRKMVEQSGVCPVCEQPLPQRGFDAILDKLDGMKGYSDANVRLIHRECDLKVQQKRGFRG